MVITSSAGKLLPIDYDIAAALAGGGFELDFGIGHRQVSNTDPIIDIPDNDAIGVGLELVGHLEGVGQTAIAVGLNPVILRSTGAISR